MQDSLFFLRRFFTSLAGRDEEQPDSREASGEAPPPVMTVSPPGRAPTLVGSVHEQGSTEKDIDAADQVHVVEVNGARVDGWKRVIRYCA